MSTTHCVCGPWRNTCLTCEEEDSGSCTRSQQRCGHHCNHIWTHDECCWCGKVDPSGYLDAVVEATAADEKAEIDAVWSDIFAAAALDVEREEGW